jgi:methylmalonyl-CoA mutase, N-terminal domain
VVFTQQDLERAGFLPERDLGFPGEYPFTRGIQPTMYRGRPWTMRQYAGMGDAEESNRRYKFLLANGTAGLSVAFDLPTQIGYDSDDPMAIGEVGKVGVAIDSIEDMERLFAGIPLDAISTSMTINATASILLALYVATARRAGANTRKLSGTVQNDILKEYIARGTYIYPVKHAMRGRSRRSRSGTPFRSPDTTCARRDPRRRRRSRSRWPTA